MSVEELIKAAGIHEAVNDKNTGRLIINRDKVVDSNVIPGLVIDAKEIKDGVDINFILKENTIIENPVHLCFGVTDKEAIQKIIMNVDIRKNSKISLIAHCVFPNAVDVKHIMDAKVKIGKGSKYSYFERHIHNEEGGIVVIPKAYIDLEENSRFKTEFELLRGRVGTINIDYEITCGKASVMEMTTRINGRGNDYINIKESGNLVGERSRGVLTSKIAVRQNAKANIFNRMIATGDYARGHVDCKEIIQDNAVAKAIPIVEVRNPKARITHEASIGSVDSKQLQTLMSRGLSEDESVELIISGLLS
jgi:Fe-S cluster assembly scaffold protein SufB